MPDQFELDESKLLYQDSKVIMAAFRIKVYGTATPNQHIVVIGDKDACTLPQGALVAIANEPHAGNLRKTIREKAPELNALFASYGAHERASWALMHARIHELEREIEDIRISGPAYDE